jgi:polysaccharide biosynthesis protein PslG
MMSIRPYPTAIVIAISCLTHAIRADAGGAGVPRLVCPDGVGVNIHFVRGREQDLDLIAAAGFKCVRMDFSWGGTERTKGQYTWDEYDELTRNLEKRGLRAIYILDYSNALHEDTITSRDPIAGKEVTAIASPRKPDSFAAFARWAAAAAKHYQGRGILWEIWNEPNIGFWKPKPDVRDYSALALATCRAIREADPQATILAPASSEFPWPFFESLFQSGVLEYLDAVSVHPYRNYSQGPETAAADYRRLRALIERHAPPSKKSVPIISGEWGYATHAKGVSLDTQAAFIARQQLANLYHGIPLSIWYDWKNDGTNPEYNEDNFGTVTHDLQPKPAYRAVQTLTNQLRGYRIARRLSTENSEAWVLLCVDAAGNQKLAAWTTGKPGTTRLNLGLKPEEEVSALDGLGQPKSVGVEQAQLAVELGNLPQYIAFRKPVRALTAAAAWDVQALPTLVAASSAEPVRVPVRITNPFDHPCQVRLTLKSPGGEDTASLRLAAGQEIVHPLAFPLVRRDDEFPAATVQVTYHEVQANREILIGGAEERRTFVLDNPLRLSVAPVESGLRLTVVDPSQHGFEGTAMVNGVANPVKLSGGSTEFTVPHSQAAGNQAVAVELRNSDGHLVMPATTTRFRPLAVPAYQAVLDGDAQVPATTNLTEAAAPPGSDSPFARVWQLRYQFDSGWRFVRCVAGTDRPAIEGQPDGLGIWVYGDGSGNALRLRVTDSSGQTFQPTGPNLDWTGWRWVTFDLANLAQAGHWGGADDGRVREGLRLDTVLLVDSTRSKTSGTIYFAAPALIYRTFPSPKP